MRTVRLVLGALVAITALLAVVPASQAATQTVRVGAGGDDRISPPSTRINQGDTVVFSWEDGGHDLAVGGPEGTNVGRQDRGFKLVRKLDRAGTYTLACSLHDRMTASFDVAPVAGFPEPTTPPAVDVVVGPDGGGGFAPSSVTVTEGQTVNWHWGDDSRDVTFADGPASGRRSLGGAYFGRTFTKAGTYSYRDTAQGSTGTVIVRAAGEASTSGIRQAPAGTTPDAKVTVGPGTSFSPSTVAINEGGAVEWTWAGGPHNVRFTDGTDSGFKSSGTSTLQFYKPGTFTYLCSAHSGMAGSVTVADTGAPGPNTEPPPAQEPPPPAEQPPADPGDTTTTPGATTWSVTVGGANNLFAPDTLNVKTGDAVTWSWIGGVHNVSFADGTNSGIRSSGTWTRRMLNPGTFTYVCELHSGMQGTIVATGQPVAGTDVPQAGQDGTANGDTTSQTTTDTTKTTTTTGTTDTTATPASTPAAGARTGGDPTATDGLAAVADRTAPALGALVAKLRSGRRAHSVRLTLAEDAMLKVTMRTVGRSRDLVARRAFTLFARRGTTMVRLPAMNLAKGRYRLTVVAQDRAQNMAPARTFTLTVR